MSGTKILEIRFGIWLTMLLALLSSQISEGQTAESIRILDFKYGYHIPQGNLGDRFGSNSDIGLGIHTVSTKQKILLGVEGMFIFGNNVKEDVLNELRAYDGSLVGQDGQPGDVNLKERGFYIGVNAGKIFSTSIHKEKLTGIRAQIGLGLLQHKIRVQDNANTIVALEEKYLKGYDRLTNGPAVHLGLGYHYQSPVHNLHFYIMGDLYAAQTQSRRDFDYLAGEYLDQKRTDILAGLSLGYIVTISRVTRPEYKYY